MRKNEAPLQGENNGLTKGGCSSNASEISSEETRGPKVYHALFSYTCSHCKFTTNDATEFFYHLSKVQRDTRHTNNSFSCPFCNMRPIDLLACVRHVITKHGHLKLMQCDQCEYRSYALEEVAGHFFSSHANSIPLECTKCDYSAANEVQFYKHILLIHKEDEIDPSGNIYSVIEGPLKERQVYYCWSCEYIIFDLKTLNSQENELQGKCLFCYSILKNADFIPEIGTLTSEKGQIFNCLFCLCQFESYQSRLDHILSDHPDEQPMICGLCSFSSHFPTDMRNHNETVHSIRYFCSECDYKTSMHEDLKKHRKNQHMTLPFTKKPLKLFACPFCQLTTSLSGLLDHVSSNHSEHKKLKFVVNNLNKLAKKELKNCDYEVSLEKTVEEYKCSFCDFKTVLHPEALRKHLWDVHHSRKNNNKAKQFPCPFCTHKALSSDLRLKHISTDHPHTAPSKCKKCNFTSFFPDIMKRHAILHNLKKRPREEEYYACQVCDYKTEIHYEYLKRHIEDQHPELQNESDST